MRPKVKSNRFEILFRLHGNLYKDFTAASFQTIARHQSEFHYARSHVNANNEVTSTEVKFYPEVESQTGLSSLRVSCKRALSQWFSYNFCIDCMQLKITPDVSSLEHVYMRPEVNSSRFEMSNRFEMSSCLHGNLRGDFTAATFQTIARLYCTCANDIF